MASLYKNLSAAASETITTNYSLDFCLPRLEIVESIVPYSVNAASNVLLAIVAIFANSLVFAAVRHSTSIRFPSKLLLDSLLLADIGVGLVAQPQFVTFLVTKVKGSPALACFCLRLSFFASLMFAAVSLLTMVTISLDRYIALFFHVEYHEIVTTKRVCLILAFHWLYAVIFASAWLWNTTVFYFFYFFGVFVCCLVIPVAYIKIYRGLRHHHGHQVQDQAQVQAQQQTGNTLDLAKYRRSASSMLWIYGLFILCYLPSVCLTFIIEFVQRTAFTTCLSEFALTIFYFNSSLNPFVYCFRLPEIRAKVLQILRKLCGQNPQQ